VRGEAIGKPDSPKLFRRFKAMTTKKPNKNKFFEIPSLSICETINGHVISRTFIFKKGYEEFLGTYRDAPKVSRFSIKIK
jgi:hypothetical protein